MPAETISWIAADGTEYPFDAAGGTTGYRLPEGPTGRMAATFQIVTEQLPGDNGTRLRNVIPQQRTIAIPLEIEGSDAISARDLWRALVNATDPRRGPGLLRFTPPDGDAREYRCRYQQGLEGDDGPAKSTPSMTNWLVTAQFVALDPMAQSITDTTESFSIDDGDVEFFPVFPIVLGESTVFAQRTIVVLGDDVAWPVWQLQGPFDGFTLTNVTMTRTISGSTSLGVGESLIIDTRPGSMSNDPKSVRDNLGNSRFAELTSWDLWPFTPGYQDVRIEADAATTDTNVSARWRERWSGT